jgi:hypothetical protein
MFTDVFREPTLADRLRGLAIAPWAAYLLCQVYFSLYDWFVPVPRWLFESVRLLLLAGAAAALVGAPIFLIRRRHEWTWAAAGWLGVLAIAALLCAWTLMGMSVPFLV